MINLFSEMAQLIWDINSLIVGIIIFGLLVKFAMWGYKESKNG